MFDHSQHYDFHHTISLLGNRFQLYWITRCKDKGGKSHIRYMTLRVGRSREFYLISNS